jgi:hypothetical protein
MLVNGAVQIEETALTFLQFAQHPKSTLVVVHSSHVISTGLNYHHIMTVSVLLFSIEDGARN